MLVFSSYWRVVPNRSAQNWPLQRALRNEGFRKKQLMDTGPHDSLHRCTMTAPPYGHGVMTQKGTSRNPYTLHHSKLSLRRVNPMKGLGHRDEPFRMERRETLQGHWPSSTEFGHAWSKAFLFCRAHCLIDSLSIWKTTRPLISTPEISVFILSAWSSLSNAAAVLSGSN